MPNIRVPKQSDREVVAAFGRVAAELKPRNYIVRYHPPFGGHVDAAADKSPEKSDSLAPYVEGEGRIATITLLDRDTTETVATLSRHNDPNSPHTGDALDVHDQYFNRGSDTRERQLYFIKANALCRREFRAGDLELGLEGLGDKPITKYLVSQREILAALQSTTQKLLVDAAKRNDDFEAQRQKRYEEMETEFRTKAEAERQAVAEARQKSLDEVSAKEAVLKKREEAFNTKEARYVARQKQEEQIAELKGWLNDWHLTKGTAEKRWRVELAYVVGVVVALVLTLVFTSQNWVAIEKAKTVADLNVWQMAVMSVKTVFPFALFVTLMTYYIRWAGAWARQHAEEEFRNRARIIDIGRSGWLLEAVRDAQDNKQEIPTALLQELSRNLFATSTSPDADLHPQAVPELISQGLKSISVATSADGTKVKAVRK